jgi:TRAP-type C4-dicarboxylate transport system permease small subunit
VRRLGAIVESVAAVLLAAVVLIVLVQVFGRYILRMSLSWPEELARYVLVWLMFFGVAAAAATRSQIVVDTLVELVSPRFRRMLEVIGALAGLGAVGLLVWTSQPLFGPASRSTSPATGIPSFWIYLAIPVGGALLGLFTLADLGRILRGEPPPSGGSGGPGAAADSLTPPGPGAP